MEHLEENIAINLLIMFCIHHENMPFITNLNIAFLICQNSTQYWGMSSYEGYIGE
jgi:hypothetical protein